jgi:hypothetical protein
VLRAAITASKQTGHVELMCENKEFYCTFTLDYREGRRHPCSCAMPVCMTS